MMIQCPKMQVAPSDSRSLSSILNSRWRSFSIQAMVRPKLNFKKFGQIIHFWEGNFLLSNFGIEKGGLKRTDRKSIQQYSLRSEQPKIELFL